jgi:hypothetical protein
MLAGTDMELLWTKSARESMTSIQSAPIACTLGAGDFKDRMRWIREFSAKSLRSHHREGLTLELTYDRCAAADVHEFVRREQACCGFSSLRCA